MNRTTVQIADALFRRRMAISQADALIRQGEAHVAHLTAADRSPDMKAFAAIIRSQAETLIRAADHIIRTQVTDD